MSTANDWSGLETDRIQLVCYTTPAGFGLATWRVHKSGWYSLVHRRYFKSYDKLVASAHRAVTGWRYPVSILDNVPQHLRGTP